MGIIAWIVLGLVAGLLANMLIPGKRSQGLILTCVIGIAGALGGGWAATELFHVHTLHGFFNLSTWLTAIAGSAVLLASQSTCSPGVTANPAGSRTANTRPRPQPAGRGEPPSTQDGQTRPTRLHRPGPHDTRTVAAHLRTAQRPQMQALCCCDSG